MADLQRYERTGFLVAASVPGLLCVLLIAVEPVSAQDRGRAGPSVRPTPSQHGAGSAVQRGGRAHSAVEAPGTGLPPATRPSNPPSSFGGPPSGANPQGGRAQTNDGPNMPDGSDGPPQAPLGGAEWLAAAGAAYALNRLRKRESTNEPDEE
jgi:hypothetical protein